MQRFEMGVTEQSLSVPCRGPFGCQTLLADLNDTDC